MKKIITVLIGFLMFALTIHVASATLYGEKLQCNVLPDEEIHYPNGGRIKYTSSSCNSFVINPFTKCTYDSTYILFLVKDRGTSAENWIFLEEYDRSIDVRKPSGNYYIVQRYGGCDFSLEGWCWNNGRPTCFEKCPPGYEAIGNSCNPTQEQYLKNLRNYCLSLDKYWYHDACHDEPNFLAETRENIKFGWYGARANIASFLSKFTILFNVWFWLVVALLYILYRFSLSGASLSKTSVMVRGGKK